MFDLPSFAEIGAWFSSGAWFTPLKALLAAFVFGQALTWTYEATYRGLSYSRGFGQTIILATIAAAILVQALSHSIVAGIGLLGVLSMIRFRVNLKAPRDLVFIMGAATIGVAAGVGALLAAFAGTLVFCSVSLYLHAGPFGSRQRFDGVLRFRIPTSGEHAETDINDLLDRYCRRRTLLSVGEVAQGARMEHAYQVKFWNDVHRDELIKELRESFGAADARLLLQEATLEY